MFAGMFRTSQVPLPQEKEQDRDEQEASSAVGVGRIDATDTHLNSANKVLGSRPGHSTGHDLAQSN